MNGIEGHGQMRRDAGGDPHGSRRRHRIAVASMLVFVLGLLIFNEADMDVPTRAVDHSAQRVQPASGAPSNFDPGAAQPSAR